ncbi:double-cubane-cluster-containing anaerobic reductase [Clostridioides mangenotii]|uniref:double-cubane-cluster-containing anaerobic reductase n=1 Tax=Metaclostridioides mangenotii TaxID=1540 RepID=UPI001C0FC88E|nr:MULTISPECIES: double-cubane-cluster-containing anaerobic reductase [Clostridioides]MBS5788027.1 2-hydroxyacyl-CoA dehydratase [Clostridioides difficile]MBU5308158.1 2-hydroxyacyl-CoA dehydratase family protein [Clostridioides mangenotii]MCR1954698.1 double-cubane-cluster-containing anaerobic reductase [Clostridioides mangenotii]
MSNLPKQFDSFTDARQKGFLSAKELKDSGKKLVGTFCTFTPVEIPMAAGAVTVGVCGVSEEPIPDAEKVLPRNLCPLIKSSYGHAITDTCPYFYFSDLLIGETTCDGKKKMYEELAKEKNMHVMHLPNTVKGDLSYKLWKDEIIKLKEETEKSLGVTITEDDIRAAIKDKNEERVLLKEFYELGKSEPSMLTGMELHNVLYQAGFKFDRDELKASIRKVIDDTKERYEKGECPVKKDSPRILITGSPIGGISEKIIQTLEDAGASVVALELCQAIRSTDRLVDENMDDVYDALTQKYIKIGCSCMMDNDNRFELLDRLIDEYKVDGVIDVVLQACHTFNIESYRVKEFVTKEKNKAFMSIETDYSKSDTEQLKTRFEAFVEML